MWLALGSERSEFVCTPMQMLARLDEHPDAYGQLREIVGHYAGISRRREDERLLDLEPKARSGDAPALEELNKALARRAEERGTTPDAELRRLLTKRESSGMTTQPQPRPSGPQSITERRRNRG